MSCLGITKHGSIKDLIEILKKFHRLDESRADITFYEVISERFERIYLRFTDGVLIGGNCQERLTQEETLAYQESRDVLLRTLPADEFYPLYERWIKERNYQFSMIFTYDNLKKLEECVDMIAAYDKNGHIAGLTILYKEKHYFSDYLEPILFDATDDCVRRAMIRYLAENHNHDSRDVLIRSYGKADDLNFVECGFIGVSNPCKVLDIYAQAHPEVCRIIHIVSEKNPEASGYYAISDGVATYTKEPIDEAEELSLRELTSMLFPYSNCCFYF